MMRPLVHGALLFTGLVVGVSVMLATLPGGKPETLAGESSSGLPPKRAPLPGAAATAAASASQPMSDEATPAEPAPATPGEAAEQYIRDQLEAGADVMVADSRVRDLGDGRREVTLTLERRTGTGVPTREQYAVVVDHGEPQPGAKQDTGWEVTIASDAYTLSDSEWAVIDRQLQSKATNYVHDTFFDGRADVKLHATPMGRGQYDVIVRARDKDSFSGYTSAFFHATYDPVGETWMVEQTD